MCAFGSLVVCTQIIIIMTSIISHLLICLEKKSLRPQEFEKESEEGVDTVLFPDPLDSPVTGETFE